MAISSLVASMTPRGYHLLLLYGEASIYYGDMRALLELLTERNGATYKKWYSEKTLEDGDPKILILKRFLV